MFWSETTEHRKGKASFILAEPCLLLSAKTCEPEGLYKVMRRANQSKCLNTQRSPLGHDPKACQYFKSLSIFLKGSQWSWIYTDEEYVGWHFKIQAEELCYHSKWYSTSMGLLLNAIGIILLKIVNQTWKEKLPKHSFKNSFCQKTLEFVRCEM